MASIPLRRREQLRAALPVTTGPLVTLLYTLVIHCDMRLNLELYVIEAMSIKFLFVFPVSIGACAAEMAPPENRVRFTVWYTLTVPWIAVVKARSQLPVL